MPATPDSLRKSLGRFGETFACHELEKRGYRVLARNVRMRSGEIDIVASQGGELVFVEVKTRRPSMIAGPEDAITHERMEHLETAIGDYFDTTPEQPYRIEIVAIDVSTSGRVTRCDIIDDIGLR